MSTSRGQRHIYGASRPRRARLRVLALLGTAGIAILVIALVASVGGSDSAASTARAYVDAWSAGNDAGAAKLTDQPRRARKALAASRRGLDGARVAASVGDVSGGSSPAAAVRVRWRVPRYGEWEYRTDLPLRKANGKWHIVWRPQNIHPRLHDSQRLGTVRESQPRGRILDRHGRTLVGDRPVVHLDLRTDKVTDPAAISQKLAALVGIDAAKLERTVRNAPRGRYIPVITLRSAAYDRIADKLAQMPGLSVAQDTAPLAPEKGFGVAVLGAVAPATAEQITRSNGRLAAGEEVGQWGLEAAFEKRLASTDEFSIVIRDRWGTVARTLENRRGRRGRDLDTTLDLDVQHSAEKALGPGRRNAALVALEASTGDVLAVANRPADSSLNRAFSGLYPPGSTFKVVSTTALLRAGLSVGATVPCARTAVVDGRSFRNFEGEAAGPVPFRTDFAQSCNTAFISLADRVKPDALAAAARDFGIGRQHKLALPVADGAAPAPKGEVSRAAATIGQDRILTTPLVLAGVAGTVAAGRWHSPRLVSGDGHTAGPPLAAGELASLRELMRLVVTGGTGTALASVPGAVAGKSGTAEFGTGDPPPTHAWFIAYRGDLAVAVLVERGKSGGSVAAPIVRDFFTALDS